MKTRDFRIILFATIVATILFSGVYTSTYYARPLFDENIELIITTNPTSYSTVGEQITYSFLIKNTSPNNYDSSGDIIQIVIIDNLVKNISCPANSLKPGESMTCTDIYTISQEDIDVGTVINRASLSGLLKIKTAKDCCKSTDDPTAYTYRDEPVDANTAHTITLSEPEIYLNKTSSTSIFIRAGERIIYTYTITNTGNIALEGPISVQDNRVAVYCPTGGLDIGETVVCRALYITTENDVASGIIINTALASVGSINSLESTYQMELDASTELSLNISTDPTTHAYAGQLMIYIFDITNTGNYPLDSPFTINDPLLDELICNPPPVLFEGETFECRGYYRIRESDIGKTITNCASVSGIYRGQPITSEEVCASTNYTEGKPPPDPKPKPEQSGQPGP